VGVTTPTVDTDVDLDVAVALDVDALVADVDVDGARRRRATGDPVAIAVVVAASASAGAGLVHAAAAGAHAEHRLLAVSFAAAAVVQLAWAAMVWLRPATRALVLWGVAVQLAAVAVWAVSRTTGIGWVLGLEGVEPVTLQDATATVLELLAVLAGLFLLVAPQRRHGHGDTGRRGALLGTLLVAAALPAMVTPHVHGEGTGHVHATVVAADGLPDVPGVTAAQRTRAAKLIADTERSLARFPTTAAAEAGGFHSIGDAVTGFEHFVNAEYLIDADVLDPQQPESLVFKVAPSGDRTLASAMYILPPGRTMADVPDVAGPLTQWHDHQNLCWDASGVRLAGILVNGRCTPGGTFRATPPMLHVWVVDNECGPFAGIEGSAHTGSCFHTHTS
jgi:hypothetical protein